MGRKLLSKEKIQQVVRQYKQTIPEIEDLAAMAEEHRREVRSRRQPRKRKVKQQLKSTDYLSVEQFTEVMSFVKSEADAARAKSLYLCRAVINEMLLILMAESLRLYRKAFNQKISNRAETRTGFGKPDCPGSQGGLRKRELWPRLNGHVTWKRRNSQAFA